MQGIQRAFCIGIGDAGIQALSELAFAVRQGYGAAALNRLALVGVTFASPNFPLDDAIKLHQIPSVSNQSVEDIAQSQVFWGWFDERYYQTRSSLAAYDKRSTIQVPRVIPSARQPARAALLRHLQDKANLLMPVLNAAAEQLRSPRNNLNETESILIYILVSLEDVAASALVLDMAHLANYSLRNFKMTRLMLFAGLPGITASRSPSGAVYANAFAALREIERFIPNAQETSHKLYPGASSFANYNLDPNQQDLITMLRVFDAHDALPSLWADILVHQLDGMEGSIGQDFVQYEVINQQGREKPIREEKLGDQSAILCGTYTARTAGFPVENLKRRWQVSLAYETFNRWLGTPTATSASQDALRRSFYGVPTGEETALPEFLNWVIREGNATLLSSAESSKLLRYFTENRQNIVRLEMIEVLNRRQSELEWKPAFKPDPSENIDQFRRALTNDLAQIVGIETNPLAATRLRSGDDRTSDYQAAWKELAALQERYFNDHLRAFIITSLNDSAFGLRNTADLLRREFQPHLEILERLLDEQVEKAEVSVRTFAPEDEIDRYGAQCFRLTQPHRKNQPTEEVRRFISKADEGSELVKRQIAFRTLKQFVARIRIILESWLAALDSWCHTLVEDQDSLLACLRQDMESLPSALSAPHRLVLENSEWEGEIYARIRKNLAHLSAYWQVNPDYEPEQRISDEVLQILLSQGKLETAPDPKKRAHNHRLWLDAFNLDAYKVQMWQQYFVEAASLERERIISSLQTLFRRESPAESVYSQQAYIVEHRLVLPDAQRYDDAARSILDTAPQLMRLTAQDIRSTSDANRVTLYSSYDAIPLHRLPHYNIMMKQYRLLSEPERTRLHVMVEEREALGIEAYLHQRKLLAPDDILSAPVTALLAQVKRVELFLRAVASGVIRERQGYESIRIAVGDDLNLNFGLNLPEGVWWLANSSQSPSRLLAITRFCLAKKELPFSPDRGKPVREQAIPFGSIDAAINEALAEETNKYRASVDLPQGRHWDYARTYKKAFPRKLEWAYQKSVEAEKLTECRRFYLDSLEKQGASEYTLQEEADLLRLLIAVADRLIDTYIDELLHQMT